MELATAIMELATASQHADRAMIERVSHGWSVEGSPLVDPPP